MGIGGLLVVIGALSWFASVVGGAHVASQKGRSPAMGAALGFLFGVVGLIAVLLTPDARPWPSAPQPPRRKQSTRKATSREAEATEDDAFDLIVGLSPPASSPSRDSESDRTSRQSRPSAPSRDLRA